MRITVSSCPPIPWSGDQPDMAISVVQGKRRISVMNCVSPRFGIKRGRPEADEETRSDLDVVSLDDENAGESGVSK